jgi:NAD(P)-dependent dehydrogenase (short-subunit alcohol dehydrogenase family)
LSISITKFCSDRDIGGGIGRGVIVNIASMLGLVGMPTTLGSSAYVASKHAVMGFTKTEGTFYAPNNIRINAVCPGYVGTPMALAAKKSGALDVELARVPLQREAKSEEIADCIAFLVGPMSSYMTGTGLSVDG